MNRRLLDDVINNNEQKRVDSEVIVDEFVDVAQDYIEQADDPTTRQIEILLVHFADRDPDEIGEEALSLLWSLMNILLWMTEELPLRKEHHDPEWLRNKLEFWEGIGYEGPSNDSDDSDAIESRLKALIDMLAQDHDYGVPLEEILDRADDIGINPDEAEEKLISLMQRGEVWETEQDQLETDY